MKMGRFSLTILMMAITAGAAYLGSLAAGVGGVVIGATSGVGVSALGEAGMRWLDARNTRRELRERVFLPPALSSPVDKTPNPAALLLPERAIVPFIGREPEMSEMVDWCLHWRDGPLRLLVGLGGSGKTRLVRELAARLEGWECHWVRPGEEADALGAVRRHKTLVVVDYAEGRPRAELRRLIRSLAWMPRQKGIRVLLVARSDGDWWRDLTEKAETTTERSILGRTVHVKLDAMAGGGNDYKQNYQAAVDAFSEILGLASKPSSPPTFDQDHTTLDVHVAALLAALGPSGLPTGQYDQLLDHEDRYWRRSAESCGLAHLSRGTRRQSVAELSLSGADTLPELTRQLKRVPELADAPVAARRAVAQWLQDLYPAEGPDKIGSLRPHVLAEHLAARELNIDEEFSSSALQGLSEDSAHHAFTFLGHAAQHDERANKIITRAISEDPESMILPAVLATVDTGAQIDVALAGHIQNASLSTLQLARLSAAIPWKSRSLDRTATVTRNRFFESCAADLGTKTRHPADRTEVEQRQTVLMEFTRVTRIFQEEGKILPSPIRKQLIKALKSQEDSLVSFGQLPEADIISKEIALIEPHRPPNPSGS